MMSDFYTTQLPAFILGVLYFICAFLRAQAAQWHRPVTVIYLLSVPLAIAMGLGQFWLLFFEDDALRRNILRLVALPWVVLVGILPPVKAIANPIRPTRYAGKRIIPRRHRR